MARTAVCDELVRRGLLRAARHGDAGARARLVECHLPLVRALAARYGGLGLPFDDLVQEGAIGLLEAIDGYDRERGPAFEPYAHFRVRRAIRNALTDQSRLIRLPKQVVERRRALGHAEARLVAAGAHPTPAELAAETGLCVRAVLEARAAAQAPVSLDGPVLADGSPLAGAVADPVASDPAALAIEHERLELLKRGLDRLSERERRVVCAQWGLHGTRTRTATELARELGLSPRRTQTIGHDALDALRRELDPA